MPTVFHYVEVREQIVTWICKNEKKFNELISEMSVVSDITVMAEKQEQLKVHKYQYIHKYRYINEQNEIWQDLTSLLNNNNSCCNLCNS